MDANRSDLRITGASSAKLLTPTYPKGIDGLRAIAVSSGVIYFQPAQQLCDAKNCAYGAALPFYIDFQHLSRAGAMQALKGLKL